MERIIIDTSARQVGEDTEFDDCAKCRESGCDGKCSGADEYDDRLD